MSCTPTQSPYCLITVLLFGFVFFMFCPYRFGFVFSYLLHGVIVKWKRWKENGCYQFQVSWFIPAKICRHSPFLSLTHSVLVGLWSLHACHKTIFFSFVYISHNRSIWFMNLVFSDVFVINSMLEVTGILIITIKPVYGLFLSTPFNISQ